MPVSSRAFRPRLALTKAVGNTNQWERAFKSHNAGPGPACSGMRTKVVRHLTHCSHRVSCVCEAPLPTQKHPVLGMQSSLAALDMQYTLGRPGALGARIHFAAVVVTFKPAIHGNNSNLLDVVRGTQENADSVFHSG